MVPPGFASPNPSLNASINQGLQLQARLSKLLIVEMGMFINAVGQQIPLIPIAAAQSEFGVTPDDEVHLLFEVAGANPGGPFGANYPEVSVIEKLLGSPATVSTIQATIGGLFQSLNAEQVMAKTLTVLADNQAVQSVIATSI